MRWVSNLLHPSAASLADAIDARADPRVAAHLARCPRCRETVSQLRDVGQTMLVDRVPDPSPLFWDRFAVRLNEAIDGGAEESSAPRADRPAWRRLVPALATFAFVVAAVGFDLWRSDRVPGPAEREAAVAPSTVGALPAVPVPPREAGADDSWGLLLGLAADVDLDEAAAIGFGALPGGAELAADSLSVEERDELVRLIRAEIGAES